MSIRDGFAAREVQDITQPTTTDLSHLLPGDSVSALCPTSQAGGNQVISNANAMTATGSPPSTPFTSVPGEVIDHGAPEISSEHHARVVVIGPDGGKAGGRQS